MTITGYQSHDDQLWAYPLSTVTISVNGSPYTVASSQVLPGAPQIQYTMAGTVDQLTGSSTYEACNAYRETTKYERWIRPDNTELLKAIGAGTPVGPVDVCVSTLIDTRRVNTGSYTRWHGTNNCNEICPNTVEGGTIQADVQKHQSKNAETGQVVGLACKFATSWNQYYVSGGAYCGGSQLPNQDTQTLAVPPCPY